MFVPGPQNPAMNTKKGRPDVREVVGANVKAIIDARSATLDDACRTTGIKETQLKRIMSGKQAVTVRTLERIAAAYGLEPYQLLIPGMDAKNPQVLRSLSPAEERLYKALEEAMDAQKKSGTQ